MAICICLWEMVVQAGTLEAMLKTGICGSILWFGSFIFQAYIIPYEMYFPAKK